MIKSITIKNFESHEDTTIHFGSGLNLLVGESNSGKSSIIRSAAAVVNNQWSKEMVRNGYNTCKVRMETERGWVECERGEKVNVWKCFDGKNIQEYKKVGTTVPEQVTEILGMGERDRGDVKELPNFMFQLEKHYMLSEVDGKKATSNLVARMMDNAIGLGGMEDLIKDLSSDLLKDKKWLTEKTNEITELKSQILDEIIFNDYKKLVDEITKNEEKFVKNESVLNQAVAKNEEYKKYRDSLEKYKNTKNISDELNELEKMFARLTILQNTIKLIEKKNQIEEKISKISSYSDWEEIDLIVDKIASKSKEIKKAQEILSDARKKWKKIKELSTIINEDSKKSVILEKELENIKKEMGVCPLCGGEL